MGKSRRKALAFLVDQMELAEAMLSSEELGQMYAAVRQYAMEGETPDMQGKSNVWCAVFGLMSHAQDKAERLYEETCARNRAAAHARWHRNAQ